MDILKFAMQMELDGKAFYEKGAATTSNPAIKEIFNTLAEEEDKHFRIFSNMREGQLEDARKGMEKMTDTPQLAKNIFKQLVDTGVESLKGESTLEMWQEAVKVEEKSEKMYREAADAETDDTKKALLNRIADEEQNHIYLIENMISFIKDPEGFSNSANYGNFMSWEGHEGGGPGGM